MKEIELARKLNDFAKLIGDESVEEIEFDSLRQSLEESASCLVQFEKTKTLCEKLLSDFKSEIKRMANFLSCARGENFPLSMVEKLLSSKNLDFDDLVLLRKKVKNEFDNAFPSKPVSRVAERKDIFESRIREFKVGDGYQS
ncbi:MAG: hypothetical protein AMJ90_05030 [candidate division Zixibacteria bacterium SM23_73_2]|nr:MAG: hypothetical protein AMJ90_05030 [candidate division Zixibacteria bacterium SM23_73_2]